MKHPILIGEILTNTRKGIYTQTIWYSDGSIEVAEVPKGPLLFPKIIIDCYGTNVLEGLSDLTK